MRFFTVLLPWPSLGNLPGGVYSLAQSTNSDGSVSVGYGDAADGNEYAIRWAGGNKQNLGLMSGGTWSNAYGVSADGNIVIGAGGTSSGNRAFIWDTASGQMSNLQTMLANLNATGLSSWTAISQATGIAPDGAGGYNIIGRGVIGGENHAFLVTGLQLVPEPSTYALCVVATGVMAWVSRHRKKPAMA